MLEHLPSGDPDEITVRIRLEPARGALGLADSLSRPGARRLRGFVAAIAALALAGAAAALLVVR